MKNNCTWCGALDSDIFRNIGLLLFRLVLGFFMLTHGWSKLVNFDLYSAGFSDPIGVGSSTSLILIIFAEFGCSILIILGLLTRLATIPLIIGMSVAAFIIHAGHPFSKIELSSLYLSLYVVLAFLGPGKISLDYALGEFCTKHCRKCNFFKSKTE
jgi:putative oxidoreductase